jgi:hypothetical protein
VNATIGEQNVTGVIIQLSDGSLYLIERNDGPDVISATWLTQYKVHPMDRSYAGMLLKESIRQTMREYNSNRVLFKESKYRFRKTKESSDAMVMDNAERRSEAILEEVKLMRRGWRKFKNKSAAKKRIVDPDEAARIKEAAMVAKGLKIRETNPSTIEWSVNTQYEVNDTRTN